MSHLQRVGANRFQTAVGGFLLRLGVKGYDISVPVFWDVRVGKGPASQFAENSDFWWRRVSTLQWTFPFYTGLSPEALPQKYSVRSVPCSGPYFTSDQRPASQILVPTTLR